jgi:hypothetical protein
VQWAGAWHAVKNECRIAGMDSAFGVRTPMQALAVLSKLHSGDIVLPTTDGRETRLRRVTEPTAEQKSLLDLLRISFPDRLSFNRQCSLDSATG